jgi:hypothetical protein
MRSFTTPTFSPDGIGGDKAAVASVSRMTLRAADEAERMEPGRNAADEFDDGLVHSHAWAKTSTTRS